MPILEYLEVSASWLFKNAKGRDDKVFTKRAAFKGFPDPTIEVTSPDCGPSNSTMPHSHTQIGEDRFPELSWVNGTGMEHVKQYLIVIEDPDAPLPTPPLHGLFCGIPADTRAITHDDTRVLNSEDGKLMLAGGFKWVKNIRSKHYGGPKPLLNHGMHRYFYQVVALTEPIDDAVLTPNTTRDQVAEAIVGRVAGWGIWVGTFERKWE